MMRLFEIVIQMSFQDLLIWGTSATPETAPSCPPPPLPIPGPPFSPCCSSALPLPPSTRSLIIVAAVSALSSPRCPIVPALDASESLAGVRTSSATLKRSTMALEYTKPSLWHKRGRTSRGRARSKLPSRTVYPTCFCPCPLRLPSRVCLPWLRSHRRSGRVFGHDDASICLSLSISFSALLPSEPSRWVPALAGTAPSLLSLISLYSSSKKSPPRASPKPSLAAFSSLCCCALLCAHDQTEEAKDKN